MDSMSRWLVGSSRSRTFAPEIIILESDKALELRTRDRARKLISKIDEALKRIEDGVYGYCEDTGEPIGIERLEVRPVATLSIEAQERHERMEKTYDDEA